jgi:predicted Zn-dependent protease
MSRVSPEAIKLCREMIGPDANCNMHLVLAPDGKGINAHADGKQLVLYPAMVDFAKSDTHLALVIAHEYAHHFMQHVQATQKNVMAGGLLGSLADMLASRQGINTGGQLGQLGAQSALLSYSPSFEQEADYIGLYILARAGYPIEEAPEFWRSMSRMNPDGIYNRTTHPTTPERYVLISRTIEEIRMKQQQGQRLLPNIKPQKS